MNEFETKLIEILESKDWKEPTKKEYPSYLDYEATTDKGTIFFEDIHFAWKLYKPVNV
jgi:hypothetical protein